MNLYTNHELRKIVREKLQKGEQKRKRLRVFVQIALLIRKVHKKTTERFKNERINYVFDRELAIVQLRKFDHTLPADFIYLIRKFSIGLEEIGTGSIFYNKYEKMIKENDNNMKNVESELYEFTVALKYLCRNSSSDLLAFLSLFEILELINISKSGLISNQLVRILGYMIEKSNQRIANDLTSGIYQLVHEKSNLIDGSSKEFLFSLIKSNKSGSRDYLLDDEDDKEFERKPYNSIIVKNQNNQNKKANKQVVTKTIQTVKSMVKNRISEETDNKILNLASALKNRIRKKNMKVTQESIETDKNEIGDNRSIWRNTWAECLNLYQSAKQGQPVKSDDKDYYLPNKLFGYHFQGVGHPYFFSFFIQRMIVSTLLRVSKKQTLSKLAIQKLSICIDSLTNIIKGHLGYPDLKTMNDKWIIIVRRNYYNLEASKEPDILNNLVVKMIDKMMKEEKSWIIGTYKVEKEYYSRSEVATLIRKEVEQLRIDAVNALYNSALRDNNILTKDILKKIEEVLNDNYDEYSQEFDTNDTERFKNFLFKMLALVELNADLDYKGLFRTFFKLIKESQTCSYQNMKSAVNFLLYQSKDRQRSEELFTDSNIHDLIEMLNRTNLNQDIKSYLIEIINNNLEHDFRHGLNEEQQQNLIHYVIQDENSTKEVIDAAFLAILQSVEKEQSMQNKIRKYFLVENTILMETYANHLIFILSRIKNHKSLDKKEIETLSKHLENGFVIVDEDDSMFKFEKFSNTQLNYQSVSYLACRLILVSIENKNEHLSSDTAENLLLSIERSVDKQTKIISAKCIYRLADYFSFDKVNLNTLKNNVSHEVYDVGVYLHTAYVKCLAKLSRENTLQIESHHLEILSSLHIKESLKLGEHDFTMEINNSILQILKYEAKKQKFIDENLFNLFDDILYTSESNAFEALDILENYTLKKYTIPASTVAALEDTLMSRKDLYDKALLILQCVIQNGQAVDVPILHIFTDNLYNSNNSSRRFRAFKLLEQARLNQELPDEIFFKLELEKVAFGLCRVKDTKPLLDFLKTKTDIGYLLPIDTMIALENNLDDQNVLEILLNVTRLKQTLSYELLNKLTDMFDLGNSNHVNQLMLGLFSNISQNYQRLTPKLLDKLESALDNNLVKDKCLSIFVYRAQKGEELTGNIIVKLLDSIDAETNLMIKQEYLSSLGSLILNNSSLIVDSVKQNVERILSKYIEAKNANTQNICINGWRSLLKKFKVDIKYLEQLIQIATNPKCDESVKKNLKLLFDSLILSQNCLTENLKAKIELDNLEYNSNEDRLDKICVYMNNENNLLEQNYDQLAILIDEGSFNLKQKTLNLLNSYKYKDEISENLIESIVFLHESTRSTETKSLCSNLLTKLKKHPIKASMILQRENSQKNKPTLYSNTKIYNLFKNRFKMDDTKIRELFKQLNVDTQLLNTNDINSFLSICLKNIQDYYDNPAFIFLIEQVILDGKHSIEALICYNRIIEEKKYQNLEGCLEKLIQSEISGRVELLGLVIECIFISVEKIRVPFDCLKLLESHMEHKNEFIRSCSFRALRVAVYKYDDYSSDTFNNWCDRKIAELSKLINVNLTPTKKYLDLLGLISSLSSIDFEVFKTQSQKVWKQELLISCLFKQLQPENTEKMLFYTIWFEIKNKFKYINSIKILQHLHDRISIFRSMREFNETVTIIKKLDLDTVLNKLRRDLDPFQSLRIEWCVSNIMNILTNKEEICNSYIETLAHRMLLLLDLKLVEQIFQSIIAIDNLKAFESLIDFCYIENVKVNDVRFENVEKVRDLQSLIEVKHICNNIKSSSNDKSNTNWDLFSLLFNLMKKNWTYDQIMKLIDALKCRLSQRRPEKDAIDALKVIDYFKLSSMKYDDCLKLIDNSKHMTDLLQNLNQLAIENSFQEKGKIKDAAQLLAELEMLNSNNGELLEYIRNNLPKQLKNIKSKLFKSSVVNHDVPICEWSEKYITKWANEIVSLNMNKYLEEGVAVIKRANFIFTKYELTDAQILCSLISLKNFDPGLEELSTCRGKLLEVATGEGKSTIVCILAIINALRTKNSQVNIITSSSVLAERDAQDKTKLFKMFNLKCSHNNDAAVYIKGSKECYKSHIVYGEVSQFQFDHLRDNYSQLGTLAGRECKVAIIDEVDAMLIDDSSKISRLSSTAAGLDHFHSIYIYIWQKLLLIKEKFILLNGRMYMLNGKVFFESNGQIRLEFIDEQGEIKTINDLEAYINENSNISTIGQRINGDIDEFLKKTLNDYVENLIENRIVQIPDNFQKFFNRQLPKWIQNAIEAMNYQQNVHYVVQEGQIKPVDYFSTGIVQSATNWSDGLHQFLQLKHNLRMTCETFTTNFLSNIGFINAYDKVYGLTGTLGSVKARSVLKKVYKVDLINVSQLRQKQYIEYPTIVAENETKWIQIICSSALVETKKNRGILIICETIEQANQIGQLLKEKYIPSAVKLYTMNNMDQEKQVEKVVPGEIIIATNLAGRGTNIQADAVEHTGGLHVILIFMPNNQRVEDQAFGRTARQGKRGTGQMILNLMNLIGFRNVNHNEVKHERDLIESKQLIEFQDNELRLINAKDKLFRKFSKFLNEEIRADIREKSGLWQKTKSVFTFIKPSVYEQNVLAAIEEQWAMFLHGFDDGAISIEKSMSEYDSLEKRLRQDYKLNKVIKNQYYHTVIGNHLIANESNAKKALEHFQSATVDSNFSGSAFVGICWSTLSIGKNVVKRDLLDNYHKALNILASEMGRLNANQILLQKIQTGFVNSDLDRQLSTKTSILGSYLNSVQSCYDVIKKSMRLFDVVKNDSSSLDYYYDLERDNLRKDTIACVDTATYQLTFNNLTAREDSWTVDQACQNIHVALREIENKDNMVTGYMNKLKSRFIYNNCKSSKKKNEHLTYEDIGLKVSQITLSRLKSLLSKNVELDELNGALAITKLKETRSYMNAFGLTNTYYVDVRIVHMDNTKKTLENMPINELIALIETNKDKQLTYYLKIKEANENEINISYLSETSGSNFDIQFDGLDHTEASKLQRDLTAEYVNIEFRVKKSQLLPIAKSNLFNDKNIFNRIICTVDNKTYSIVDNKKLMSIIEEKESNEPFYLKIECAQIFLITLLNKFPQSTFNITFNTVSYLNLMQYLDKEELEEKQIKISFENLNKSNAEGYIKVLRQQHIEFSLEFKNLNHKQLNAIIAKAHLEQEEIQISSVKNLAELFMKSAIPQFELNEFSAKGIEYLIEINEKMFVPWFSVAIVACIGLIQTVIGGFLIASGFGATLGMSLVSEGLADLFYAYRAYSSRQFSWGDYATQKAVSIAISVVTAGYGNLKDAGKAATTLTSKAGKEIAEEGAKTVLTNGKTVAQQVTTAGKNLKSLAFKYVGAKTGEAVVRESLNNGVQLLTTLSFDLIKSQICENMQERLNARFCSDSLNRLLRKMYALDVLAKSKTLQGRVEKIVCEIMNPERSTMNKLWDSIGVPLLKGILSDEKYFGNSFSMGLRILGTLHGLYEIQAIIDKVYTDLVNKLTQIDRDTLTLTQILHEHLKLDKETSRQVTNELKLHDIDEYSLLNLNNLDMIYISTSDNERQCEIIKRIEKFQKKTDNGKVSLFLKNYCDENARINLEAFSVVIKSISDKITNQVISIIQSQMITPWSTLAVSGVTDALSKRIQHYCLVNSSQNADAQNEEEKLYNDLKRKKENSQKLTDAEKQFLDGYEPFNTFTKQINENAKQYIMNFTRSEAAYYAKKQKNSEEVSDKVKERADEVEKGKKPASLAEISLMIEKMKEEFGINVKVVDDPNYQRSQEDIDSGVEIVYIKRGVKDENGVDGIGHAQFIDKVGHRVDIKADPNDCVYGVFSKILEKNGIDKPIDKLRSEIAKNIRTNANYEKVIEAEKYMHERYPHEANSVLFTAGLINNDGTLEVEDKDLDKIDESLDKGDKRGKPYDDFFQAQVPKGTSTPELITDNGEKDDQRYTFHHITPNHILIEMLKKTKDLPKEERKKILNDYLNMEHIKKVIIENNLIEREIYGIRNHGRLIQSAVTNNPNNLVYGPGFNEKGKTLRGKEPKEKKDEENAKKQTADHQNKTSIFEQEKTLKAFGDIPATIPVNYKLHEGKTNKDKTFNKYYAE